MGSLLVYAVFLCKIRKLEGCISCFTVLFIKDHALRPKVSCGSDEVQDIPTGAAVGVFSFIWVIEISIEGGADALIIKADGVEACGDGAGLHHLREKSLDHLRFPDSHFIYHLRCDSCHHTALRHRKIIGG